MWWCMQWLASNQNQIGSLTWFVSISLFHLDHTQSNSGSEFCWYIFIVACSSCCCCCRYSYSLVKSKRCSMLICLNSIQTCTRAQTRIFETFLQQMGGLFLCTAVSNIYNTHLWGSVYLKEGLYIWYDETGNGPKAQPTPL